MKKLLLLCCLIATMTSCLSDSDEPNNTVTSTYVCYNNVQDSGDNTTKLTAGSYTFEINFTKNTVGLTGSVILDEGSDATNMNFGTTVLTYGQSGYIFSAPTVTPQNPNDLGGHTITNLKGKIYIYMASNGSNQASQVILYELSYVVDGKYTVNTVNKKPYYFAKETVTTATDIDPYKSSDTQYFLEYTAKDKANLTIYNAKFASNMPQQNFTLKDLTVETTPYGYSIKAAEATPYINNVPNEGYKLKNLLLSASNFGSTMNISFNCTIKDVKYRTSATACTVYPSDAK